MRKAREKRPGYEPLDQKAYQKAWRAANVEKIRGYYQANKAKICAQMKAFYAANAEAIKVRNRAYYAANKGTISAKQKGLRKAQKEMIAAQRQAQGDVDQQTTVSRRRVVLTPAAVTEIRQKYRTGMSTMAIASQYGVGRTAINAVLTGKNWRHVPDPDGPIVMRGPGRRSLDPKR
jgi:hypothetical protein